MKYKWTFAGLVLVLLASLVGVAGVAKKSHEQCFDAGGLIVQTDKGWRCVKEAQ